MLFKQMQLEGIKNETISLAFRKWKQSKIKRGSRIKTSLGIIEILSIEKVQAATITERDAAHAGYNTKKELLAILEKREGGTIYKIGVGYYSEDPRIALREQSEINPVEIEHISEKLNRLDTYSRSGDWTREMLTVISENPHRKAADLAEITSRDKAWLKRNIRKLKNLGLTKSHNPGYTLSPRGEAYLKFIRNNK